MLKVFQLGRQLAIGAAPVIDGGLQVGNRVATLVELGFPHLRRGPQLGDELALPIRRRTGLGRFVNEPLIALLRLLELHIQLSITRDDLLHLTVQGLLLGDRLFELIAQLCELLPVLAQRVGILAFARGELLDLMLQALRLVVQYDRLCRKRFLVALQLPDSLLERGLGRDRRRQLLP